MVAERLADEATDHDQDELAASRDLGDAYVLMRIYAFCNSRRFYRLTGDLEASCDLRPVTYTAVPH